MNKTEAHEIAEQYAGYRNENATVTEQREGIFKVELSSDITVYVNSDGDCELA
jgi:hypothetical protein